jgi:hypothetical protein
MDNRFFERPNGDAYADQRQCAVRVRRGERVIKGFSGREDDPDDPYPPGTIEAMRHRLLNSEAQNPQTLSRTIHG